MQLCRQYRCGVNIHASLHFFLSLRFEDSLAILLAILLKLSDFFVEIVKQMKSRTPDNTNLVHMTLTLLFQVAEKCMDVPNCSKDEKMKTEANNKIGRIFEEIHRAIFSWIRKHPQCFVDMHGKSLISDIEVIMRVSI